MAFTPGSSLNTQTNTTGFVPGSSTKGSKSSTTFVPGSSNQQGSSTGSSPYVSRNKLQSSQGLYSVAVQNGLQREADNILKANSGEETKKYFSGGAISDIFDVLSTLQYGTVGVLQGKTFREGVKSRSSFTENFQDKGIPGMIAGIVLDIAFDPLTYIAPATLVKKIPALARAAKIGKEALLGKTVTKAIQGTNKTYEALEATNKLQRTGQYFGKKVAWMFGADPIFKETFERGTKNVAISTKAIVDMGKDVADLTPETAAKLLRRDETGRFARVKAKELAKILKPEEFETVSKIYNKIDALGKEAVDLGLLSKAKYEENIGEYLKNAYKEYEESKGVFGFGKVGVKGIKARKEGLTLDKMQELGQIDNPAYLLFKSALDLTKDVENAKLLKNVAEKWGTDIAQEGFVQIPNTAKFVTTAGKKADLLTGIKKINTDLKPLFSGLKQTFKADKKVMGEISKLESEFLKLSKLREEELYKFFNEGTDITKKVTTSRKLGTIPEKLQPLANAVKRFDNFDDMYKSDIGIKLEKAFINGDLERQGFSSMESFFNTVKNPYKKATEGVSESIAKGDTNKLIRLQKQIEKITEKSSTLSEIDKRSINDSLRILESNISDLRFKKEDLVDELAGLKYGDLAGKYIPKDMADYINEIIPATEKSGLEKLGQNIIGNFKFAKVVMNPATHARNIASNKILNYWKLGMNPLDPRTIRSETKALKEITKGTGKYIDEATPLGYNIDTFASAEMKGLLDSPDALGIGKKKLAQVAKKLGDIYQAEENQSKLAAYIFNREVKKMNPEEAWKLAEAATFNYAQVTPFVRKLRESFFGLPFITFTAKATPAALETIAKNPGRISVIQKIKQGIEAQAGIEKTDDERRNEPEWVKNGFYVRLPGEDSRGRARYFDMTYLIPFGELMTGSFTQRPIDRETGTQKGLAPTLMSKSPVVNLIGELSKNRDFYGNKIWRDSDPNEKQMKDLMLHLTKTIAPPVVSDLLPGGYDENGERRQTGFRGAVTPEEEAKQKRTIQQELLRLIGAKIQPIDADIQETYTEWNRKKGLQTLLRENGIGKDFNKFYIPK